MSKIINRRMITRAVIVVGAAALALPQDAVAEGISLNYDSLSSLEEPLAFEVGDITVLLTGLVDVPVSQDFKNDDTNFGVVSNFQVTLETQLANRWTAGLAYFGQFESDPANVFVTGFQTNDNVYSDNVAGFISGIWGGLYAGNLSGLVRENTRRMRGVGNAWLGFDDVLGGLDKWGAGYMGRYGPFTVSAVIDEAANFDLGLTFGRPISTKDYRFSARYTNSRYMSADGLIWYDTHAFSGTAEVIYGSTLFDATIGFENFSSAGGDVNRVYSSLGVRHKVGALSMSLEGHYGQIMGQDEVAVSAGAAFDIARGLSANFGVNYEKATIMVGPISFVNSDAASATLSLRYGF